MISRIKKYFDIQELVCRHVFEKFGEGAWDFFDPRLLETLLWVRETLGKPIYVNNWQVGGNLTQRGLRCNCCALVKEKTMLEKVYMTAHSQGMGLDFDVKGMSALEVRNWLRDHQDELPYPIRLEADVTWVHLDVRNNTHKKLIYFYA